MNPNTSPTPIPRDLPPLAPEREAAMAACVEIICATNQPEEVEPEIYNLYFDI